MAKERTPEEEEAFEEFRRARYPHERSREIAETEFARSQGTALKRGQATRLADEFLLGSPTRDGNVETFTDPQGRSNTFRAGTNQLLAQGGPVINDKLYSPYDQKQLAKLYQGRSQAATDDSLTEPERQKAMDIFDSKISRVPQLTPSRREPTAQQKFEASIVKGPDGTLYTTGKDGQPKALEQNKERAAVAVEKRKMYATRMDKAISEWQEAKLSDKASVREAADKMSYDSIRNDILTSVNDVYGTLGQPDTPGTPQTFDTQIAPKLKPNWDAQLITMEDRHFGRASVKAMETERDIYVGKAARDGVHPNIAMADFMQRWKDTASTAGVFSDDVVAPWGKEQEKELAKVKLAAAHPDTAAGGVGQAQGETIQPTVGVGPDKVSVLRPNGKIKSYRSSKEFLAMWNGLDADSKEEAQQALLQGITPQQLLDAFKARAK